MQYNRARQSQITTELSEIMGGVEAMKGKRVSRDPAMTDSTCAAAAAPVARLAPLASAARIMRLGHLVDRVAAPARSPSRAARSAAQMMRSCAFFRSPLTSTARPPCWSCRGSGRAGACRGSAQCATAAGGSAETTTTSALRFSTSSSISLASALARRERAVAAQLEELGEHQAGDLVGLVVRGQQDDVDHAVLRHDGRAAVPRARCAASGGGASAAGLPFGRLRLARRTAASARSASPSSSIISRIALADERLPPLVQTPGVPVLLGHRQRGQQHLVVNLLQRHLLQVPAPDSVASSWSIASSRWYTRSGGSSTGSSPSRMSRNLQLRHVLAHARRGTPSAASPAAARSAPTATSRTPPRRAPRPSTCRCSSRRATAP